MQETIELSSVRITQAGLEALDGFLSRLKHPGAISMRFAAIDSVPHQPDGRDVMGSSYADPDAQIVLTGGSILHVAYRDGKFRFVKVDLSGKADVPNTGSKPLSLSAHDMENCLMAGKITVGVEVFTFKNKQKALKQIRCLFPK